MTENNQDSVQGRLENARKPYTFDRVVRLILTVGGILFAVWLIGVLKSVLLPFLVAWLIAYILEPFVQYNKRLLGVKKRWLPILMTLFETALVITAISIFVVPSVFSEMHQVAASISKYAKEGASIAFLPESVHEYLRHNIDFEHISQELTRQDIRTILDTAGKFIAGGYDLIMGIFSWFIVILYIVFIMLDYERLIVAARRLVPPKYRKVTFRLVNDIKDSMNHYFRGQALVAFIVGIMFAIGFSIIRLPMGILLGLFIGLLNMVPYLQLISLLPTTLLCLVYSADTNADFWHIWWSCMAVYIIVQCIQDLVLTPKIMGKAMGLNPAIILLSLSVWGTLLGFIGLIIALPLTTLLLAYYDMYITNRDDGETPEEHRRDEEAFRKSVEAPEDEP